MNTSVGHEPATQDWLIAEGENTVKVLGQGRDRQLRTLDGLNLSRTKSRLSDFERDVDARRDRLDGIEPPTLSRIGPVDLFFASQVAWIRNMG